MSSQNQSEELIDELIEETDQDCQDYEDRQDQEHEESIDRNGTGEDKTSDPKSSDLITIENIEELPELIETIVQTGLNLRHIYNGMTMIDDYPQPLIEFKIDAPKIHCETSEYSFRFINSNHPCGWFAVDTSGERLVGPLIFDATSYIQTGVRRVAFQIPTEEEPDVPFVPIENVDNDSENMIDTSDIPRWMIRDLMRSICIVQQSGTGAI